ncbi:MAG: ABC transporter permease [Microbacteriaceae bacterium]
MVSTEFPVLMPPGAEHWFGTDNLGRDLFARILSGGRVSLIVGLSVAVICLIFAIVIGGIAGFWGGWVDLILNKVLEFFQVIPTIVLALVAAAMLGSTPTMIVLILGVTMWPPVARIMRAEAMRIRELGYIESARSAGFSDMRIFLSDVVPNAFPPVLVTTTMTIGRAILLESGLAFLGLGDANNPSWGALLYTAQPYMQLAWWLTIIPGACIFIVVLAMNMLGDNLNDSLNPTISRVK